MTTPANQIIASLPEAESRRILMHCDPVDLVCGDILCEPNKPYPHVYFPLSGFISMMVTVKGHHPLEMALVGNEGMLGATLALDVNTSALHCVVRGAGPALRITVAQFRYDLGDNPILLRNLKRYLYILLAQQMQTAVCTHFHLLLPRLASWFLMIHDRARADQFHLTHEFLAGMLGVRRSGITVAAGVLQKSGFIRYSRGEIRILDRPGLETASCECYAAMIDDYRQLLLGQNLIDSRRFVYRRDQITRVSIHL